MSLVINTTHYQEKTADYTIPSVASKRSRIKNTASSDIIITIPEGATVVLSPGVIKDFWYDGIRTYISDFDEDYGDKINSDDTIYLDSSNPVTSKGVKPEVLTAPFRKPTIDFGGLCDDQGVPFPGRRGAYEITEQLENLVVNGNAVASWTGEGTAVVSQQGGAVKVYGGATPLDSFAHSTTYGDFTGDYHALISIKIENVDAATSEVNLSNIGDAYINWGSNTVTFDGISTDIKHWFDGKKLFLTYWADYTTTAFRVRVYPDRNNANRTVIFKDVMVIDFGSTIPFPVDHFEGINPASEVAYSIAPNGDITFHGKFQYTGTGFRTIWYLTNGSNTVDRFYCAFNGNKIRIANPGATFDGTTVLSLYEHYDVKWILKVSGTMDLYLNGNLEISGAATSKTDYSYLRRANVGSTAFPPSGFLNGLSAAFISRPSIDTTTTHNSLGQPWIDPNAKYDYRGNKDDRIGNLGIQRINTSDQRLLDGPYIPAEDVFHVILNPGTSFASPGEYDLSSILPPGTKEIEFSGVLFPNGGSTEFAIFPSEFTLANRDKVITVGGCLFGSPVMTGTNRLSYTGRCRIGNERSIKWVMPDPDWIFYMNILRYWK